MKHLVPKNVFLCVINQSRDHHFKQQFVIYYNTKVFLKVIENRKAETESPSCCHFICIRSVAMLHLHNWVI